ncbi:isoleucyl-tRNA synthetase [Heterostelium album PN500]|uniref:isoleucine--tRNA ligase n=1 Tax=Heterostelium pallidum (strain ATCC 26659 / Pp 5 / PN500) TaxID=670386 RepID=D3BUX1_HETP5|nr:isoleucyl-tRNA synthetase [Heterostelium album PN500]EFA74909.1 isoleucyl-tRNA synthetase [Heterostelium album PN500]|eukprot:XP_020427043.1 isoleucyl-tRNA synthetase [Heterostelium album PN500]
MVVPSMAGKTSGGLKECGNPCAKIQIEASDTIRFSHPTPHRLLLKHMSNFIASLTTILLNLQRKKRKLLNYWDEIDAFETSLKMSEGKPEYNFYDGPPFATGLPHYGHILAGTIKDTVTRYAHQTGHHVARRFGWDCHGLPIEYEIDKLCNVRTKDDVMKMGIPKYNQECRNIVMKYSSEWEVVVKRLGRWIDMKNNYKTMDPKFMESVWWVFKQLYEKGLVYQGFKVMPYSIPCTTPLSNFEAGSNYKDVPDPAVVVAFPIVGEESVAFVAWTTTPWTLPCNLALVVNPNMDYVRVLDSKTGKTFILAEKRLSILYKDVKPESKEFKILAKCKGAELVGKQYVPMFDYFASDAETGAFRVIPGTYVTEDSGTGIVHAAPAYGEEDFNVCLKSGIIKREDFRRPSLNAVDVNGCYTADIKDFAGKRVKTLDGKSTEESTDKEIIKAIKAKDRLVNVGTIVHSYPFCWRSDTPLIYKAVGSWFVRVENMRERLLKNNSQTYWVPDFVKEKRFANWLEAATDWAVSRNRYWGTPIPLWVSEDGEEVVAVGSVEELYELSGVRITDLHRESIDHITIPSKQGKGQLKRIEEVFDCWFESGSMPYAQQHYPFENKDHFESIFPAQFIAEGIDQTRGWFYTLLVLSTALFDKPPFQNLIANGLVLAADGKKMSKRLKNYPDPMEVIGKNGSDALRLYLITSPVVRGETLKFQEKGVADVLKDVFLPWFNAYRFMVQNALRHEKVAGKSFVPDINNALASTNIMDRWILASCQSLIKFVREEMAAYRLYTVVPRLTKFIEQLTNWYVRLNRKRFKGAQGEDDALHSLNILYEILLTLSVAMAPFTPFLSEYMYQNLKRSLPKEKQMDSVHYCMYPEPIEAAFNVRIEEAVGRMQTVIELGRVSRDRRTKPIKNPLQTFTVITENKQYLEDLENLKKYIIEELNVQNVVLTTDESLVTVIAEPDRKRLGQRLKTAIKEVSDKITKLTHDELRSFQKNGEITIASHVLTTEDLKIIRRYNGPVDHYEPSGNDEVLTVLDLNIDQVLLQLGVAREVTNRIQRLRKKSGLAPEDPIKMFYNTKDGAIKEAILANTEYLNSTIIYPLVLVEVAPEAIFAEELASVTNDNDFQIWFSK